MFLNVIRKVLLIFGACFLFSPALCAGPYQELCAELDVIRFQEGEVDRLLEGFSEGLSKIAAKLPAFWSEVLRNDEARIFARDYDVRGYPEATETYDLVYKEWLLLNVCAMKFCRKAQLRVEAVSADAEHCGKICVEGKRFHDVVFSVHSLKTYFCFLRDIAGFPESVLKAKKTVAFQQDWAFKAQDILAKKAEILRVAQEEAALKKSKEEAAQKTARKARRK